MNSTTETKAKILLSLADDKLAKLKNLQESLQWLHDHMEESNVEEILAELDKQSSYRKQIIDTHEKYELVITSDFPDMDAQLFRLSAEIRNTRNLPEWYFSLYEKLKKQQALLINISTLNAKTKEAAIRIQENIKDKIKQISQHKNIIQYYHHGYNQTGNLFDFKEGKRR